MSVLMDELISLSLISCRGHAGAARQCSRSMYDRNANKDVLDERRGPCAVEIWRVTMRSLNLGERLGAMVAFSPLQNTNEPCIALERRIRRLHMVATMASPDECGRSLDEKRLQR